MAKEILRDMLGYAWMLSSSSKFTRAHRARVTMRRGLGPEAPWPDASDSFSEKLRTQESGTGQQDMLSRVCAFVCQASF